MLAPGEIVGDQFRVERPLAEGGFGEVYVATQLGTGKPRALKVLRPEVANDPRTRDRFIQEAQIGARIASDHVVEVVAAGIDAARGAPWLAMELLEGETLEDRVRERGPCSVEEALAVFSQLGHALGVAHAAGVVHRDLKPENIFVATARRHDVVFTIKVLDFGIARLLAEARDATMSSQAIGSPLWMAPEQLSQGAPISPATDVWALGLIAFFALTGRSYWQAGNTPSPSVMTLIHEIATAPILPAGERARLLGAPVTLPVGFDAWFARCVARDPTARFRDAGEATAALASVLGGSGAALAPTALAPGAPSAPAGTPFPATHASAAPPPAARPKSALPWVLGLGGVLVVLGIVALGATIAGVALFGGGDDDDAPPPVAAVRPPVPATDPEAMRAPTAPVAPAPRPAAGAASAVVVSASQSCARFEGSGWWCWGTGAFPSERGLTPRASVPVALVGVPATGSLALGGYAGCAIDGLERALCWGMTVHTSAGDGGGSTPAEVADLEHVREVALGVRFACARTASGYVECWGDGDSGQLGRGRREERSAPARVEGLDEVEEIDAGVGFVVARRRDGSVWSWGDNVLGELGTRAGGERATPAPIEGLRDVVQVAVGGHHGCARLGDGTVQCWGGNVRGQLGDGTTRARSTPRPVRGLGDAVDLVASHESTCARRRDGTWWCWGLDYQGVMIGAGRENVTTPFRVEGLTGAVEVGLGRFHGCARTDAGAILCWGNNEQSSLGDGTEASRLAPAPPRF